MPDGDGLATTEESADDLLIRASELHERVGGDPSGVRVDAEQIVAAARQAGHFAALVEALMGLAEAHRYLLQPHIAVGLLNEASRVARRRGTNESLGEVLLARGVVRHELGRIGAAREDFDLAERLVGERRSVEVALQRAALAHNAGRLREAAATYTQILRRPDLSASHRTRAANNLGLVEAMLGRPQVAMRWLDEAARQATKVGPAYVAQVVESQAWATVKAGWLTEGVARFDDAVALWRKADLPLGELYTEYADALFDLRLLPEAREQAERAAAELRAHGVSLMAAEAELRVARLALAIGDWRAAEEQAERVAADMARQRRVDWRARATLVAVEARLARRALRQADHGLALRIANTLLHLGMAEAAADALLTAGRVAAAGGRHAVAAADWDRAAEQMPRVPVLSRVKGHLARALAARHRGDDAALRASCRAGLRDLATHRAALPTTELRALASGHGAELASLGLGAVWRTGSPAQVLAWMEQTRANALSAVEPEPVGDGANDLRALRAVQAEVARARRVDNSALPGLMSRRAELEARIRRAGWTTTAPTTVTPRFSAPALREALGDRVLVAYDVFDGRLVAVVADHRRTRVVALGQAGAVGAEIDALRSALHALNVCVPEMARFLHENAVELVQRLGVLLVEPLGVRGPAGVVVVPVGELQRVPWSAMFDCPVSVAPSATTWVESAARQRQDGPVLLTAGPGLEGAVGEVDRLAAVYGDAVVLTPPASDVDTVRELLDTASLAHLACHGEVRTDNPTFSSLRLSDGSLTVHELDRHGGAPHQLVLAACDVGDSVVYPGNEVLGFIGTLLTRGAAGIVASTMLVLDDRVTSLMVRLHEALRDGLSMADALYAARASIDPADPRAYPAWCTFTAYGAG